MTLGDITQKYTQTVCIAISKEINATQEEREESQLKW